MARRGRSRRPHALPQPGGTCSPPRGGRFRPLSDQQLAAIVEAAFDILSRIGLSGCPDGMSGAMLERGATRRGDGRITFPRQVVERALASAAATVSLPGFCEHAGLEVGGGRVHIGTGGAAVEVLDASSMQFRPADLADLYRLMRIVGAGSNIHYGVRPVVARDMSSSYELDVNTAFACMKASPKPIGISFDNGGHVASVVHLFDLALGGEGQFRRQPFCFAVIVHAVSPLRYSAEGLGVIRAAIAAGIPLQICSAAQAGATSPVTLAGALAQGLAECLAGLMVVDALRPGFPCIFAFMPFISDLRTGAMTGGGGEAAVANAAAAQLLGHLNLPSTVSAGMTDAKLVDAQAGYEKGYTVALSAQAGADMINLSVGMLGSIMAASPEAFH